MKGSPAREPYPHEPEEHQECGFRFRYGSRLPRRHHIKKERGFITDQLSGPIAPKLHGDRVGGKRYRGISRPGCAAGIARRCKIAEIDTAGRSWVERGPTDLFWPSRTGKV